MLSCLFVFVFALKGSVLSWFYLCWSFSHVLQSVLSHSLPVWNRLALLRKVYYNKDRYERHFRACDRCVSLLKCLTEWKLCWKAHSGYFLWHFKGQQSFSGVFLMGRFRCIISLLFGKVKKYALGFTWLRTELMCWFRKCELPETTLITKIKKYESGIEPQEMTGRFCKGSFLSILA